MEEFIKMVQEHSKDSNGNIQYVYCAGYFESLLKTLEREVPGVQEYIAKRIETMNMLNKKVA